MRAGHARRRRVRIVAIGGFVVGLSLVAVSSVMAVASASSSHEAEAAQASELSAASRQASAELSRQVDVARLAAMLSSTDPALVGLAQAGGGASVTDQRAGAVALQNVVSLRSGLASVARLRGPDGGELASAVDTATEVTAPVKAIVSAWVAQALASPGTAASSAPHLSSVLGMDVISTAVSVGGDHPTGVVEIETSVDWLREMAAHRVPGGAAISFLPLVEAQRAFGQQIGEAGTGLGSLDGQTAGWSRTAFDDQIPGQVGLDWVVAVSGDPVGTGWDVQAPLTRALFLLGILGLLLALAAGWAMVRRARSDRRDTERANARLEARLADMSEALGQVADGDLGAELPVEEFEDDALRDMAGSFDSTLVRLRGLVGQAQEHGVALSQASVELRAAATQQATAATEQSSVVTETTATIEELAATAAQIAQTAEQVAQLAAMTLRFTEEGRASVVASVEAMDVVTTRVATIGESAVGLGETGREIGRILDVIDDLSERTNLLALNAAIEAARAGEHGQGFAVVAAEVRRLAERARAATNQIQGLVSRIGAESSATVLAAEEGQQEVDRARVVAHDAADSLDRIASMVDETTMATREISIATQQQRSASDQVVVAMAQVSDASRQYAVGSQQAAASAEELAVLAETMRGSIGTFTVASSRPPVPRPPADDEPKDSDVGDESHELVTAN